MRGSIRLTSLAATLLLLGGTTLALAQQAPPPGGTGMGGGMGHGAMGGAGMGMGHGMMGAGFQDPADYLNALKADLAITPKQETAWKEYADTVEGVATQMQGAHQMMYDAMGTATWEERRDMMDRMFEARQQAMTTVHEAAHNLLPALSPHQRRLAATSLPGLRVHGRGMMRHMAAPPAPASPG